MIRRAIVVGVLTIGAAARADNDACITAYEKAQVLRKNAHLVEARDQLVLCAANTCPDVTTHDCLPWLRDVEAALPTVVVGARLEGTGDVVDVRVSVDGRELPMPLDGKAFPIDPGMHTFRFERTGADAVVENVLVREGDKNRSVTVTLRPHGAARSTPSPTRSGPSLPLVLGAIGLVPLVFGAIMDVKGFADAEALKSCTPSCVPDKRDFARTELIVGDVFLGVGIAITAVAAVWFFMSRETKISAGRAVSASF